MKQLEAFGFAKMARMKRNVGFGERMFLDEAEWGTYRRRMPVRYIRRPRGTVCQVCGLPDSPENPLQSAHIIGFDVGVIDLGLTPDYLDSDKNILTAHRRTCNRQAELDLQRSMDRLWRLGIKALPDYLPAAIQEVWGIVAKSAAAAGHGGEA